VAGAAALLWSRNPSLTVAEVKAALLATVDPLGLPLVSAGRLNVQRALAAVGPVVTPPTPVVPTAPKPVKRVVKKKAKKVVRVALCHRGRTIKVLKSQVRKHRKHGDKLGACRKPKRKR
jgi:hypothetical protein